MTCSDQLKAMAKFAKANADALDKEFLKYADPRAVQAGASDEAAQDWRKLARELSKCVVAAETAEAA